MNTNALSFRQLAQLALSGEFMLPEGAIINRVRNGADDSAGLNNLLSHASHYAVVAGHIRPEDNVLDIGCGCGFATRIYCMMTSGRVVAIDKQPAIEVAQRFYPASDVEYLEIDLSQDRLPHGPFDLAICIDVYEHLARQDGTRLLESLRSCLTEKGYFLISTPFGCEGKDTSSFHLRHFDQYADLIAEVSSHLLPTQKMFIVRDYGVVMKGAGTWNAA